MREDTRTSLERWWDAGTRMLKQQLLARHVTASPPDPQYVSVLMQKGTGDKLDPSAPWMRWNRVFDRLLRPGAA